MSSGPVPGRRFGGPWTEEKLSRVDKYLGAYMTIFKGNASAAALTTNYVDAFAGTGRRSSPVGEKRVEGALFEDALASTEAGSLKEGSAYVALSQAHPFDRYIFVDREPGHAQALEKLREDFPELASRIRVETADANEFLVRWCNETDWAGNRAVVFLDPYGMQVDWTTIESLARTQAVDPETAPYLRRLFWMVGHEGTSMTAVRRAFEDEGVPTPGGGRFWHVSTVRRIIDDEIYVPRTGRELAASEATGVPPAVAAALVADTEYGVYWWGRSRVKRLRKVRGNEPAVTRTPSDPSKHVAIPVESVGVPAEWVAAARKAVSGNVKPSFAGGRPRELSGGLLRCPCGSAMTVFTNRRGGRRNFFYVCGAYRRHGKASGCSSWKYHKVEPLEARVREFAYRVASNPDALREKLQGQLDQEHTEIERAHEEERALLEVLRDAEAQRERIVRLYARGGLTDAEYDAHAGEIAGRKESAALRLEGLRESETGDGAPLSTAERVALFESYLRDLPGIVEGFVRDVREYETVPAERTAENPHGISRLTKDSIRWLSEEETAERRAELEDRRAIRYLWLYETLSLSVTAERDGTLDVRWGAGELRRVASTVT